MLSSLLTLFMVGASHQVSAWDLDACFGSWSHGHSDFYSGSRSDFGSSRCSGFFGAGTWGGDFGFAFVGSSGGCSDCVVGGSSGGCSSSCGDGEALRSLDSG